jgi:hypothetical protein
MMGARYLLIVTIVIVFAECKKEKQINYPSASTPPAALLKEIVIPHLPSPYYHFEYDATGNPNFASFASDFTRYNIIYDAGRIHEMRNDILVNKDRLQYSYDSNGNITSVDYADSTGAVYTKVDLFYSNSKLIKLERARKSGADFVLDKRSTMSYYEDGNLKDITYHYLPFNGQTEAFYTSHFEWYDNKPNPDWFDLIHNEFFDHFFLLPGVQLQKNNPGREIRTGDGTNYTVDYIYNYNEKNFPLNKKGSLLITNGPDAGKRFETNSFYSYY